MRSVARRLALFFALLTLACLGSGPAKAEDGYELWLRYRALPAAYIEPLFGAEPLLAKPQEPSPTVSAAVDEWQLAAQAMTGRAMVIAPAADNSNAAVTLVRLLPGSAEETALGFPASARAPGAFRLRTDSRGKKVRLIIAAYDDAGLLYGSFAALRHLQLANPLATLDRVETPRAALRMLDHWDNIDGSVERGYAGQSIFRWWHLPAIVDPRLRDYARANASIGINAVAVNNVNASAEFLSPRFIAKAAAVADLLRPYGIRLYLSARFSAPRDLGGLQTADPLDPAVAAWWQAKSDEIYAAIPDFGGFLVKANSEGQPGPQDYGRSHADGANMLARAVGARGVVIWRAFVYAPAPGSDRTMQAHAEFHPLDGKFDDNVIVQIKNGPLDFQPREPVHPLFGAMPRTHLGLELQITKEYLGFSTHLAFLAPLFEEVLDTDTRGTGAGATVADIVAPSAQDPRGLIAGVANIGSDRNWSGSDFDQANWFAFGRLAWNPAEGSDAIARDWLGLTFSRDPRFVDAAQPMMLASREAVVDYMTPLGLAHLMGSGHHYGPAPWVDDLERPDWNPVYFHRADAEGIGFDRTAKGSNALSQYAPALARRYADRSGTALPHLLWFHRVGWDERLPTGRTLWDELVVRYDRGVAGVAAMNRTWAAAEPYVDAERFAAVSARLRLQAAEAQWWRDACLAYFQSLSGRDWPEGHTPPPHPLDWYRAHHFPEAPGQ